MMWFCPGRNIVSTSWSSKAGPDSLHGVSRKRPALRRLSCCGRIAWQALRDARTRLTRSAREGQPHRWSREGVPARPSRVSIPSVPCSVSSGTRDACLWPGRRAHRGAPNPFGVKPECREVKLQHTAVSMCYAPSRRGRVAASRVGTTFVYARVRQGSIRIAGNDAMHESNEPPLEQ